MSVAVGAFGAHSLRSILPPDMLAIFETAARYQMYHAIALLFMSNVVEKSPPVNLAVLTVAGWCFVLGTMLFCGSLYLFTLSQAKWVTILTPVGGTALFAGWALLAVSTVKKR